MFTSYHKGYKKVNNEDIGVLAHDAPSLFRCVLSSFYEAHARTCKRYFLCPYITMSKRARHICI